MLGNFKNYKLVYSHLFATYFSNWWVRLSYALAIISRIVKLVVLPIAVSLIITNLSKQNYSSAYKSVIFFAAFSLILGIITPLIRYVGMQGENKIYKKTTGDYIAKLISADMDYFNSNLSGSLTTATRHYVDSNLLLVRAIRNKYLNNILSIIFPICVIIWFDAWLGIFTLLLSTVQAIYIIWSSRAINTLRSETRRVYKYNTGKMADIISNILTIKSTAQEKRFVEATRQRAANESKVYRKRYMKQAILTSYREALTVTILFVILLLTVYRMSSGSISITVAVLVITYTTTIIAGIYALSEDIDEHDDLVDKIISELGILTRKNKVVDPINPKKLSGVKGDIIFENVSFSYAAKGAKNSVYKSFYLKIPHGQKLGVVGASGAGKSTLTKLLLRFDDVNAGAIKVDSTDIRQLAQSDLRKHIALVPQEPMLFHTTIRDNVVVAKPDADDKAIGKALQTAHALSFVNKLPDGINSIVGERGVKLSGGQKQRIAIARAVLQDAPIIVLDEATSALDSESEQIIKDAFSDILRGKTAIVTAHRLSTLSEMDRIIVIEKGKIIEDGTHEQLLAAGGKYAKLWRYQQRLSA